MCEFEIAVSGIGDADLAEEPGLVVRGEVDALLADLETCHFGALRHPEAGLRAREPAFTTEPIGIAVKNDDPQFYNLVENYVDANAKTGLLNKLRKKWFEDKSWVVALP